MATGMSKAHARQASANKIKRQVRRTNAVTESNKLRRLMAHAKRRHMFIKVNANASDVEFFRILPDGELAAELQTTKAWSRYANRTGVAKARDALHQRGIPQANTTFSFERSPT